MGTFEVLLVEFRPADGLRSKTLKLLSQAPGSEGSSSGVDKSVASSSYSNSNSKRVSLLDGGDILGGSDDDDEFGGW